LFDDESIVAGTRSERRKRPTQADVAQRAGVSQAIVSYVLNERSAEVAEETRERVLQAIDDLGYVPDGAARSLRTRKTMTLALIIPDITNPFYPAMERGIQRVAEEHGYDLIVSNTDGIAEKESHALHSLLRGHVDGAVMTPFQVDHARIRAAVNAGIAIAMNIPANEELMKVGVDFVNSDTYPAARMAVEYLIERGHKRIGMIAGIPGTPPREQRVSGFIDTLRRHGLPHDDLLIRGADYREAGGYEAMIELLKLDPRPTAVFAANDLMALGAMIAIREAGLSIPNDMAIIGLDDIPAARLVHPALTTVAQHAEVIGTIAANLVISRLSGLAPSAGRFVEEPVELIVRDSA
jgi:LacI family transcriptional regulator